jgi:putative membrane protein
VSSPLPVPVVADVLTRWTAQPVAIVAILIAFGWYAWSVRTLSANGSRWPRRRSVAFGAGLIVAIWTTCGLAEVYGHSLYWIWTSQQLLLLLIVPTLLMAGQPIELARRTRGEHALVVRLIESRTGAVFGNPLVGPLLIPVLTVVLFFGPLPAWAINQRAVGWGLPVLIVAVGALIVLPLVTVDDRRGSMAIALALTIGLFELLLDAVPGIVLRLQTHLVTSYFDYRTQHTWAPSALADQQIGGAIVWCVAELIDLPFLLLIYLRWLRADERDAAEIDTVLEAERIARGEPAEPGLGAADTPWWLTDPAWKDRFRD